MVQRRRALQGLINDQCSTWCPELGQRTLDRRIAAQRAILLEGAVFTQPRGPQNVKNNAVSTRLTMRVLPHSPPPSSSIRRILPTTAIRFGLPCCTHAVCMSLAMSATGPNAWFSCGCIATQLSQHLARCRRRQQHVAFLCACLLYSKTCIVNDSSMITMLL